MHKEPVSWQVSEDALVRMGVRDKYGALGAYDAVFVVTDPAHKTVQKKVHVSGSDWKYVIFPDDFAGAFENDGKYTWVCRVHDRVVVRGGFIYTSFQSGGVQVKVPRNY